MLAFSQNNERRKLEFQLSGSDIVSSSASWGRWKYQSSRVYEHCGPRSANLPSATSSTTETTYDQCVFIRALRVYRRNKLLPLRILKAAADHWNLDPGFPPEDGAAVTTATDEPDSELSTTSGVVTDDDLNGNYS